MSTTDIPTVLADALHREAAATPVTDSHLAVHRLERTVREHSQRRRLVLALAAAAVTVGVLAAGAALVAAGDDRAESPPAEKQQQARELPPPGHRIVFSSVDDEVLLVDDRGGAPAPVLDGTQPRFSPDGRRLVYADADGVPSVATVGQWLGEPLDDRPLEGGYERVGLTWSPDGTRVAYVEMLDSDFPEGGDLFVVDVASATATKVRHFAGPYVKPLEWSPDGSSLLMGFDRSGEGGRLVVDSFDLSTGDLTPLLRGSGETLGVRYSPDGSQIAFYSDSRACICVAAPDGSGTRVVLQFSGAEPDSARLAWSPDGTQIVWTERFGGRVNLLDVGSGVSRQLTAGGGRAPEIDWERP
jgi:Tol biopolymer transport system component